MIGTRSVPGKCGTRRRGSGGRPPSPQGGSEQAEHPKADGEHEGGQQADSPSHAGDGVADGGQLRPRGQTGDGLAQLRPRGQTGDGFAQLRPRGQIGDGVAQVRLRRKIGAEPRFEAGDRGIEVRLRDTTLIAVVDDLCDGLRLHACDARGFELAGGTEGVEGGSGHGGASVAARPPPDNRAVAGVSPRLHGVPDPAEEHARRLPDLERHRRLRRERNRDARRDELATKAEDRANLEAWQKERDRLHEEARADREAWQFEARALRAEAGADREALGRLTGSRK